jgi:phage/plasmid-like protein (TIGR03299 family)
MAHAIAMVNGMASMAYVGEKAWHGLGQELQPGQTIEQWQDAAGMLYTVERAIVQFHNGNLHQFKGKDVLYRSDNNTPLGIVSDGYKVVQPSEVLEFFRDLCKVQGFALETAGVLKDGALYWALARSGHEDKESKGYVLLSTSADGSRATDARFTAIRVVCNNTLTVALSQGSKGAIKTNHRSVFSASATKEALGLVDFDASWKTFQETMRVLADIKVSSSQATAFFADLLRPAKVAPINDAKLNASTLEELLKAPATIGETMTTTDKATRAIRGLEDLVHSYYQAPGAVPGTAYGLVQGVTHYIDHVRGTSDDKRLTSAWFGQGDTIKQTAVEKALALAA